MGTLWESTGFRYWLLQLRMERSGDLLPEPVAEPPRSECCPC
jgi:hypothetical protein